MSGVAQAVACCSIAIGATAGFLLHAELRGQARRIFVLYLSGTVVLEATVLGACLMGYAA